MKPCYLGATVSQVGLLRLRRADGQAESQKVSPAFMAILDPCAKLEQDHPSIPAFRGVQRVRTRRHFGGVIRATCIDQRDFNAILAAEMPYPKLTGAFKSHPMLNAVV